eukprot:1230495-Prorocentrum_lima.AAC.1
MVASPCVVQGRVCHGVHYGGGARFRRRSGSPRGHLHRCVLLAQAEHGAVEAGSHMQGCGLQRQGG